MAIWFSAETANLPKLLWLEKNMEIGLGLDSTLRLSLDEQNQLCETAVELGR